MTAPAPVLSVQGLTKSYHGHVAVRNVSFDVHAGEIFGLLGSNGAGKTTTLEIVEGLRTADEGVVRVFGMDLKRSLRHIRNRMGVSLQTTRYWDDLRVGELLRLFRSLYTRGGDPLELLQLFDLAKKERALLKHLSGGERQRVALCLALVNDPDLILLDEPTVGLDPHARRALWKCILTLKSQGKAVVLTTHFMDEAEALCDRVAILHRNAMLCCDRPSALIRSIDAQSAILFDADDHAAVSALAAEDWCSTAISGNGDGAIVYCKNLRDGLTGLLSWADDHRMRIENLRTRQPTLEDIFLQLTGSSYTQEKQ